MSAEHGRTDDLFPWEDDAPPVTAPPALSAPRAADEQQGLALDDTPGAADDADVLENDDELEDERCAPPQTRLIAPKEYYSISEVCELVGLKPHVLRYWETQFQVLNPSKNRSGNRVYQRKEIRLILLVKHLLYDEKYTVEGAKAKLDQMRRGGQLQAGTARALDHELIQLLRDELAALARILTPPVAS